MAELGRLESVQDLNAAWKNESSDFTPWLQKNIDLLSSALGVDIQPDLEREVRVGAFFLDLLGKESGYEGRPVIIENQLDRSDHSHLGQLLTYAAGKKGGVIVWVAKQIRAEHREALEWLNDATQDNIDFYGVEVQLVKIGPSQIAPNLIVAVSPRPPKLRCRRGPLKWESVLRKRSDTTHSSLTCLGFSRKGSQKCQTNPRSVTASGSRPHLARADFHSF